MRSLPRCSKHSIRLLTRLYSVVTIHGLQGDIEKTWTHQPSQCFWPRDCLAHDVPAARILAYGYNADAAFGGSTATVEDHAKDLLASLLDKRGNGIASRPLVFVAHSLGGIIVKQVTTRFRGREYFD